MLLTPNLGSNLIIAPITQVVVGALFFIVPHKYLFRACTSIDNILDFDKKFGVNGNVNAKVLVVTRSCIVINTAVILHNL